jgi:hypothetical protein
LRRASACQHDPEHTSFAKAVLALIS